MSSVFMIFAYYCLDLCYDNDVPSRTHQFMVDCELFRL